jgi:hypothetical protein
MDYFFTLRILITALVMTLGAAILYQVAISVESRPPPPALGREPG